LLSDKQKACMVIHYLDKYIQFDYTHVEIYIKAIIEALHEIEKLEANLQGKKGI